MATQNILETILTVNDKGTSTALKKAEASVIDFRKEAEKAGKDVSKAFDKTGKSSKNLGQSFTALKGRTIAMVAAITAAIVTMTKATNIAGQYELATKRLAINLELVGLKSRSFSTRLIEQASALQKTTRFSDTAIISVQSLLVAMGIAPEQMEKTTQAVIDLTAAMGGRLSLESAAANLAKSLSGSLGELAELLPALKGTSIAALQAGAAIDFAADRFAGAAAQEVETFSGAITRAGNALADVFKELGNLLTRSPFIIEAINFWADAFDRLSKNIDKLRRFEGFGNIFKGESFLKFSPEVQGPPDQQAAQKELQILKLKTVELAKQKDLEQQVADLRPKFDQIANDIRKESELKSDAIRRELRERLEAIDKASRVLKISVQEEAELRTKALDIFTRKQLEAQQVIQDNAVRSANEANDRALNNLNTAIDLGNIPNQINAGDTATAVGTAGGAIIGGVVGGPAGAVAGAGVGGSIVNSFKGIGQAFKQLKDALFNQSIFIDLVPSAITKFAKGFAQGNDALVQAMVRLTDTIEATRDRFLTSDERLARSRGTVTSSREQPNEIFGAIARGVRQEGLGAQVNITRVLENLADEANAIGEITDALIRMNEEALGPINQELQRLVGARSGAAGVFQQAVTGVRNLGRPATAIAGDLRSQFASATGEERTSIGQQLAGALSQRAQAAQTLAASGAITGEEFRRIQENVLKELEETGASTLNEFDQLIATQEEAQKAIVNSIDRLRESAVDQLDKLEEVRQALMVGNLILASAINSQRLGQPLTPAQLAALTREAVRSNAGNIREVIRTA